MAATNLPDDDHILRYVPWQRVAKDADDNVLGILAQAFELRPDEEGLSVNWLERVSGNLDQRLRTAVQLMSGTMNIGSKGRLAQLNVGNTKRIALNHQAKIRIVHDPEIGNEPHSSIRQLPREDAILREALAREAVTDHFQCGPLK